MRIFLTAIIMWGTVLISSAHAEVVIGRWCDQMIPNNTDFNAELTLVIADDGKTYLKSRYGDGSDRKIEVIELGNEIYQDRNSKHGDKYRIIKTTGELQLLDDDGLIRTARRLENEPNAGDCLLNK